MNKILHYDFTKHPKIVSTSDVYDAISALQWTDENEGYDIEYSLDYKEEGLDINPIEALMWIDETKEYFIEDNGIDNNEINLGSTHYWEYDNENKFGYYVFNGSRTLVGKKVFNDNANQSWTVSAWIYLNSNTVGGQYLNNFNLGNRIVHSASGGNAGKALLYINSGVNDAYAYSSGVIPSGKWINITYVLNTSTLRCQFYLDGSLYGSSGNYASTDNPNGFPSTHIIGQGFSGKLADLKIFDRDLTSNEILNLYESRAMITNEGEFIVGNIDEVLEPTINYYDLDVNYRCWNGGSSNVCSLTKKNGRQEIKIKGQASVSSTSGYAYVYPFYTVPKGIHTFSCVIKNNNLNSTNVSLRIRDGNNGSDLSVIKIFTIDPGEIIFASVTSHKASVESTITSAISIYSDAIGYVDIEIFDIQLELKNYPSSFTSDERSYYGKDSKNQIDSLGILSIKEIDEVSLSNNDVYILEPGIIKAKEVKEW